MNHYVQKISKQIDSLQSKIDSLSGVYRTNTWKRQREQQERDRKKELLRVQKQLMEYLLKVAQDGSLSLLEQQLTVSAFYEDMRCLSERKKYCDSVEYNTFSYPRNDQAQIKRLQRAGIMTTEQLCEVISQYEDLMSIATTPPDRDAERLRNLLYRAQMSQKGDIQFTPDALAKEVVEISGITSESHVLEPEAGIGSIADAAREITDQVDCVELMCSFREILKLKGYNLISDDLLETRAEPIYDAVIMNPPFSEECEHIKKAFDFVRPGGTLTSICSNGISWKTTRKYEQFREWLSDHAHCVMESKGVKFEMTGVSTVILHIKKAA